MHGMVSKPYMNVPKVRILRRPNLSDSGPAANEPTTMPMVDQDDSAPLRASLPAGPKNSCMI